MSGAGTGSETAAASDASRQQIAAALAEAIADDIELLASLHDREPTREVLEAARKAPIADQLAMRLQSERGRQALSAFARMLVSLPPEIDAAFLDELAADFAAVYLRHSYRAAPTESVWRTEDGLERQAPMFRVREWYRRRNLVVTDWASRPDDHIVLQLRFVAHLLREEQASDGLAEAARFLDAHLLTWVHRFAERLVHAGAHDWYAAVALLTACYLEEARGHLAALTGVMVPASADTAIETASDTQELPYVPGAAPSW